MNNAPRPAATMNEEINNSRGHVPSRLMAILDHEDVQQSMHWLPDGKAFRISRPTVFIETALKKYFKGVKFISFQTSLLQWGFEVVGYKVNSRYVNFTYSSPLFLRDQPELCNSMRRVKKGLNWNAKNWEPRSESKAQPNTNRFQSNQLPVDFGIHTPVPFPVPVMVPMMPMQPYHMQQHFQLNQESYAIKPSHVNQVSSHLPNPLKRDTQEQLPEPTKQNEEPETATIDKQQTKESESSFSRDELTAAIAIAMLGGQH